MLIIEIVEIEKVLVYTDCTYIESVPIIYISEAVDLEWDYRSSSSVVTKIAEV